MILRHRVRSRTWALAAMLGLLAPLMAGPAADAYPTCATRSAKTTGADSAWIMAISGGCSFVGVRHRYDLPWSMNNYYTAWVGGTGWYVQYYSPNAATFLYYETMYW